MYTLINAKGLHLMQVDGNTKDYSFTSELRLAMKFESEVDAKDKAKRLPLLLPKNVAIIMEHSSLTQEQIVEPVKVNA